MIGPGSLSLATGGAAPAVQATQPYSAVAAASRTAPVAPTPMPAVQQSGQASHAAVTVGRRVAPEPAAAVPSQRLQAARLAWIDGPPGKAPGVWSMFPVSETPDPGSRPLSPSRRDGFDGGQPAGVGGMREAVMALRDGDAASVSLGVA